jgi:hypothetical protein
MRRDAVLQGRAFQKLHGDERPPVLLANVVNCTYVGVIECGCSLGLAFKTCDCLSVTSNLVRQNFERHEAMETCVLCFKHNPHTAAAQLFDDAVVRDGLAYHGNFSLCATQ